MISKLIKIKFLTSMMFAALPVTSVLAAETSGGTVNFTGKVVASACAISSGSTNINVDMGEVRTATLAAAGSEANTAKTFSITLEDCDIADTTKSNEENPVIATTASITFSGTPDNTDSNSLAVGANGGNNSAQHVAIRFYDEQGKILKLGEPAAAIPLRKGSNTLNFSAKYYSPQGGATAGDASAIATYTVTYS